MELVYKDKERTKVQGIRFSKDGYSFKGTQISRGYSFGKLNARFEGTENLLSARASSAQQYEQGCRKNEQVPSISESSQDPWDDFLLQPMLRPLSHSQRMNHPRRKRRNAEEALAFDASYKPFKQQKKYERRTIGSHLRHS